LVLGETCKDIFVYCEAKRLAPDFPVPVLEISSIQENPGMAMNVQRNILQIRSQCDLITNSDWEKVTKTRYIHENTNHMFIRIDTPHKIPEFDVNNLNLNYDIIVISDYNKGFLSIKDIEYITNKHDHVFLDTKKVLGSWAEKCRFVKVNDYEYKRSEGQITKKLDQKIIRTLGKDGCMFQGNKFKTNEVEVKDSSGAGDAFFAAFIVNLVNTGNVEASLNFANTCASQVVSQKGVSLICPKF
jgi:bifunctional ADP-heptose synthase (sugar kinase/adenylyltransferase)